MVWQQFSYCGTLSTTMNMKLYMAILLNVLSQTCHSQTEKDINLTMKKQYLVSAEAKSSVNGNELKQAYGQLSPFIKNGYTSYYYHTTNN